MKLSIIHIWLLLLLATALAYAPALRAPFDFDDIASIQANPTIRQAWPPGEALHPPGGDRAVSGRPVVNYTLALNYALNRALGVDQRADPYGPDKTMSYHIVNILLHLACGALLFLLVRDTMRLGRVAEPWRDAASRVAVMASALWLIHPLQTEAVNYVVQRTEVLVSLFYVLTVYAAARVRWAGSPGRAWWWRAAAIASCILGVCSKEVMLTAPLVVLLYDRAFCAASWKEVFADWRDDVMYAALWLTAIIAALTVTHGARTATVGFSLGLPWYEYLFTQGWAIPHYLRQFLWPSDLTIDYGQGAVTGDLAVGGLVALAAAGIATVAAWRKAERWGWLAFLGSWFFLLLAPSSSVVPIASEVAAERRVYLALAVPALLIAIAVERLRRRGERGASAWLPVACGIVAIVLLVLTGQRSDEYMRPDELWAEAIARVPTNARAYMGLAHVLVRRSPPDLEHAAPAARAALALDATYDAALQTLAAISIKQGKFEDAKTLLERDLAVNPRDSVGATQLGMVLVGLNQSAAAAPYLAHPDIDALIDADPQGGWVFELATSYMALNRPADAAPLFEQVLALNPDNRQAPPFLADALLRLDRPDAAAAVIQNSINRGTATPLAYALLAAARAAQHDTVGTIAAARVALNARETDETVRLMSLQALAAIGNR